MGVRVRVRVGVLVGPPALRLGPPASVRRAAGGDGRGRGVTQAAEGDVPAVIRIGGGPAGPWGWSEGWGGGGARD